MKKLILLLTFAFVMCECSTDIIKIGAEQSSSNDENRIVSPEIVLIDSCEYIVCYSIGGDRAMTYTRPIYIHKGNCKYCAERHKKEQEELIRKLKEN